MGKKRRQHAVSLDTSEYDAKRVKFSQPVKNSSTVKSLDPDDEHEGWLKDGESQLQNEDPRSIQRKANLAAQDWLTTELDHLRELEEKPGLMEACTKLIGEKFTKKTSKLTKIIVSKKEVFMGSDFGIHALQPPAASTPQSKKQKYAGSLPRLPALPAIEDPTLAKTVFTHRSTLTGQQNISADRTYDYERLEFLGDSYLFMMCSRFLFTRFPRLQPGPLAALRQKLVCNETFAQFALRYGLDERVKVFVGGNFTSKGNATDLNWKKILGDVFEAYVAAVVHSRPRDGYMIAETWLRALWIPLLPGEEALEVPKTAKTDLSKRVVSRGIKLVYEETKPSYSTTPGRDIFTLGVFLKGWGLDNVRLGEGSGFNKMDAGQNAANNALTNPVTSQIALVKRRFDELWREESNREEGPRQEVLDQLIKDWI